MNKLTNGYYQCRYCDSLAELDGVEFKVIKQSNCKHSCIFDIKLVPEGVAVITDAKYLASIFCSLNIAELNDVIKKHLDARRKDGKRNNSIDTEMLNLTNTIIRYTN